MKHYLRACITLFAMFFLTGCATTISSSVASFHEWPANIPNKSFVFEQVKGHENNLEYRSYQNLTRTELQRLGFIEKPDVKTAKLKVSISYGANARDVRIAQSLILDPFGYGPFWRGYYGPFYDPFWYGPPVVEQQETPYELFRYQLRIAIAQTSDSKKLYDVTVSTETHNDSLASVMPYMVRSAFIDFPGPSGVSRHIELPIRK